MPAMRYIAATGILGYGFSEESLKKGIEQGARFIGADCGSTDGGPHSLGSGEPGQPYGVVRRDLNLLTDAAKTHRIPLILGSAGTAGADSHLAWMKEMLSSVAKEQGRKLKVAVIHAEQQKETVKGLLEKGKIEPLGPVPPLDVATVDRAEKIVGMMGVEPFIEALEADVDVVLAGRASDTAIYASLPILEGEHEGTAYHLAKLVECGAAIAVPKMGQDCILATLDGTRATVVPLDERRRCTRARVSAHTLYENSSAERIYEPGGYIYTTGVEYEQIDERTVGMTGCQFVKTDDYTVKLEGAERIGYRYVVFAGLRDPILLCNLDNYLESVAAVVERRAGLMGITAADYRLSFTRYGRDGVLGTMERPDLRNSGHEVGVLLQVVADDSSTAEAVASLGKTQLLHTSFEGQLATSGNAAFPFSPEVIPVGDAYQFSVWHLAHIQNKTELFPIEIETLG